MNPDDMLQRLSDIRPLHDPMLIAGFSDHLGATPAATMSYLVEHWGAELVAEFDPELLFDYTSERPVVRLQDGKRVLEWSANRLYVASPAGAGRDLLLLAGIEPQLRWRTFCEAIASFMHEVGATTSLTLGSYPGPTPHTRSVPLRLTTSDDAYGRTFGIEPTVSRYQGAMGIAGVLNIHQRSQQFRNVSLSAITPFYVAADRNPHAIIRLIEAIDRGLGITTPLATLRRQAAKLDASADEAVGESEQLRDLIRKLEQQADGGDPPPAPNDIQFELPPGEEVVAEVEEFLSQQRDAGSPDPSGRRDRTPGKM
jgi:proteasome assembly chaperone (PAC2) family protein